MHPMTSEKIEILRVSIEHFETVATPAYERARLFHDAHRNTAPRTLPADVRREAELDALQAFYMLEVQRRLAQAGGDGSDAWLATLQATVAAILSWLETGEPVPVDELRKRFERDDAALAIRNRATLQHVLDDSLRVAHEVKGDPALEAAYRREVSPIRARVRVLLADLAFFRVG